MPSATTTHADFYVAVATVIPVLLVVYAVALKDFASGALKTGYDAALKELLRTIANAARGPGRVKSVARGLMSTMLSGSYVLGLGVVGVLVLFPALAEYEALHALAYDSASSVAKTLTLIGVIIALAVIVLPLVATVLLSFTPIPAVSFLHAMLANRRTVRSIYSRWADADHSLDWAAGDVELRFIDAAGTPTDWTGRDQMGNLVARAWDGVYPSWEAIKLNGDTRVVVDDAVATGYKRPALICRSM
jgi:hypothetical protein